MEHLWTDFGSNSAVFKDMSAMPSNGASTSILALSDSDIETGPSVEGLLDLIYGLPVPGARQIHTGTLKMIQKYDCASARRLVLYAFESELLTTRRYSIRIFRAAAILNSVQTCQLAIRNENGASWASGAKGCSGLLEGALAEHPTFDLRAIPLDLLESIPIRFSAALQRARLMVELESTEGLAGRSLTRNERDRCADEFVRLMEAKRK